MEDKTDNKLNHKKKIFKNNKPGKRSTESSKFKSVNL